MKLHLITTLKIIGLAIIMLIITQFIIANELVGYTAQLTTINSSIDELTQENTYLNQQLSIARSLTTIESQAQEIGFVKPTSIMSISSIQPVALR